MFKVGVPRVVPRSSFLVPRVVPLFPVPPVVALFPLGFTEKRGMRRTSLDV